MLGGQDLDFLSVFECGVELHQRAVDFGATATVAQIGVQTIGEINRRGTGRQIDHPALRRDDVNGVVQRGTFVLRHPIRRAGNFIAPRQQLTQQRYLFVIFAAG